MTNTDFTTIAQYRDIESINYYADQVAAGLPPTQILESLQFRSRDNARTPMQWDARARAGFTTGTPWIAVNPNHVKTNVEADRAAGSRSICEYYRRLITLRHNSETVSLGSVEMLEPEHPLLYVFTRSLRGEKLLVVGNFSAEQPELPSLASGGSLVIGNYEALDGTSLITTLRPWEARVLKLS